MNTKGWRGLGWIGRLGLMYIHYWYYVQNRYPMKTEGLPWWLSHKESACNVGDVGLIPGSGRSPGKGNGIPLQYFCLGNPKDRRAWWDTVHGVARVRHNLMTKPPQYNLITSHEVLAHHCFLNQLCQGSRLCSCWGDQLSWFSWDSGLPQEVELSGLKPGQPPEAAFNQ